MQHHASQLAQLQVQSPSYVHSRGWSQNDKADWTLARCQQDSQHINTAWPLHCFSGLQLLHLQSIAASQPLLHSLFASVPNVRELVLRFLDDSASLPDPGASQLLDISDISQLQQLRDLRLIVEDVYFNGGSHIAQLQQLTSLEIALVGSAVLAFGPPQSDFAVGPGGLRRVKLTMPSVFDVTACLEALHAMETVEELRVKLGSGAAGSPSGESHWGIKPGRRHILLSHLTVCYLAATKTREECACIYVLTA